MVTVSWDKISTKLDAPKTAKEAIEAAHLDWEVKMQPLYFSDKTTTGLVRVPKYDAIVRSDNNDVFGIMTRRYTPLQNVDAFRFFDAVVGSGGAIYERAWSFNGGRRICILAKLPQTIQVVEGDTVNKYILLSSSHDGSKALTMKFVPIRMLNYSALGSYGLGDAFYARHTPKIMNRTIEAKILLGLAEKYFADLMSDINRLVDQEMSASDALDFVRNVYFLEPEKDLDDQHAMKRYAAETTIDLFKSGAGNTLPEVQNTAWAMMNAVAQYVDYFRPVGRKVDTGGDDSSLITEKRINASWFGSGQVVKQKAWDLLLHA